MIKSNEVIPKLITFANTLGLKISRPVSAAKIEDLLRSKQLFS